MLTLGLSFLAYMSSSSLVRTLLMACIGLLLGMVGIDNMTGHFRYSFDLAELGDGIGIVPVAVGLFGLGEILSTPSHTVVGKVITPKLRELLPNRKEWGESIMPIARLGGDEFVVLLPLLGRREDSEQIADKTSKALREPICSNHQRLSVSACVGIAVWPLDGNRPDPLLRFADAQMYGKKERRWCDAPPKSPEQPAAPPAATGMYPKAAPERSEGSPPGRPQKACVETASPH